MFLEITVQAQRAKPSTAKDTKDTKDGAGRAVRVRKAHVRPGGLREHGGLRTPRFGEGALSRHFSAPKRREEGPKARNGGRRARSAAEPQSDRWSPKRFAPPLASLRFTVWAEAKLPSL